MNKDGVDRGVGHGPEASQHLVRSERDTGGIAEQPYAKDARIWWQSRDALLHLLKGKIVEVREFDPARVGLGCLLESLLPGAFERRRPHDDRDISCRGCNLQHVFKQA